MASWLTNFTQEIGGVIANYPALLILTVLIFIAIALLWIWFKVPVASSSSNDKTIWETLLNALERVCRTIAQTIRQLFIHARFVVNANYDLPLYLVLQPLKGQYLIETLPAFKMSRHLNRGINELLTKQSRDRTVALKRLALYDVASLLPDHLRKVIRKIEGKRPQRPLDGLLLVLPSQSLFQQGEAKTQIDELATALQTIDQEIPFTLPVYVIVSQCHSIQGFKQFAANNQRQQNEIFGWSNDLDINMPYRDGLIDSAFESLTNAIKANQVHRSAANTKLHKVENFLLADLDMAELKIRVSEACSTFFKDNHYDHGYFFRGLYFVGSSDVESVAKGADGTLFLDDLLQKKVAAEANLATPTQYGRAAHRQFLGRYKKVSLIAFMVLCGLGSWSLWSVDRQFADISKAINNIQDPSLLSGSGYGEVARVLKNLSDVNASSFTRLVLPISWFSSVEDDLINHISQQHFGRVVFPVMECRMGQKLSVLIRSTEASKPTVQNASLNWPAVSLWLKHLADYQSSRGRFIKLSQPSRARDHDILVQFSDLIGDLYGIEPNQGFFNKNDLYRVALEKLNYDYEAKNARCPNGSTGVDVASSTIFWKHVNTRASRIYRDVLKSSLSPITASGLTDLNPSNGHGSLSTAELSNTDTAKILKWLDYLEDNWIGNSVAATPCQKLYRQLSVLDAEWVYGSNTTAAQQADMAVALFNPQQCDAVFLRQLLTATVPISSSPFVQNENGRIEFGPELIAFRENFGDLSGLSFMSLDTNQTSSKFNDSALWDADKLSKAIAYYQAYEKYADENFDSLVLPDERSTNDKSYQLQDAILKQLRLAIEYQTNSARQELATSVQTEPSADEQQLVSRVQNFKAVSELLLQINTILSQLGFENERQKWLETTRNSAQAILTSADQIATQSRLYLPQVAEDQTQTYVMQGLYGFSELKSLNDFLSLQRQRASFIAQNYTQAALTYLLNTASGLTTPSTSTQTRWQKTLSDLHKYDLKNPASSLSKLEASFAKSMALTIEDCPSEIKVSAGEDVFTQANKTLSEAIMVYCSQTLDSTANDHYQWVVDQFNQSLAGRYPFGSLDSPVNKEASHEAVISFFNKFDTFSEDLLTQLDREVENDDRRQSARNFVSQLVDVSTFFKPVLTGESTTGLSVQPYFRLLQDPSTDESNILSQRLYTPTADVQIPGSKTLLSWSFGDSIGFQVKFASTSGYTLTSHGASSGQGVADFSEEGRWALLRLIQRYQSKQAAVGLIPNQASQLLAFPLSYTKPTNKLDGPRSNEQLNVVLGISVFGTDPKTKQLQVLSLPSHFPVSAPAP